MKKLTRETILLAEHSLIGEASMFERDDADGCKLAYYNEGAHDMVTRLLEIMENENNDRT